MIASNVFLNFGDYVAPSVSRGIVDVKFDGGELACGEEGAVIFAVMIR